MNDKLGYKSFLYPDNQPHINVEAEIISKEAFVICSITDSQKLLELCMITDCLNSKSVKTKKLFIPYLMGARFDRVMQEGDSFDLKVIAKIINSLKYDHVILFDVHSDVSTALIENSHNMSNEKLVREYKRENSVLIIPDAGAAKKADRYLEWNKNIINTVQCIKSRDLNDGSIKLKVLTPQFCLNRNCVIIDDLCDGGGTFLQIANQIQPKYLTLIVSHGIFSKGFPLLEEVFEKIIVSNSYPFVGESNIVKLINIS